MVGIDLGDAYRSFLLWKDIIKRSEDSTFEEDLASDVLEIITRGVSPSVCADADQDAFASALVPDYTVLEAIKIKLW